MHIRSTRSVTTKPDEKSMQRFWSNVEKTETCWIWKGFKNGYGYGGFYWNRKNFVASRFIYEVVNGPVAPHLVVDHKCSNRACVNPDHLQAITNRENVTKGKGIVAQCAAKTHCKNGHPFNEKNTLWRNTGGRACRPCHNASMRRRNERLRAQRNNGKRSSQASSLTNTNDTNGTGKGN